MVSLSQQNETGESVLHNAPLNEEGAHCRQLDASDQVTIADELSKHVKPLVTHDTPLCNTINGRIAPDEINLT